MLEFSDRRPCSFSFDRGGEEFAARYKRGTAGRDRTGSLTFGPNPAATEVLNPETIELSSVTLTVGRNRHLLGTNASSFMNWVTPAGPSVSSDGTPGVRAGRLL